MSPSKPKAPLQADSLYHPPRPQGPLTLQPIMPSNLAPGSLHSLTPVLQCAHPRTPHPVSLPENPDLILSLQSPTQNASFTGKSC